jgi:hypothetical protein
MTTDLPLAVEQRLTHLLQHLGLAQAHWAARTTGDWHGLVTTHPDRIASLTPVCPSAMDPPALRSLAARCLLVSGDHGPAFERSIRGQSSAGGGHTHGPAGLQHLVASAALLLPARLMLSRKAIDDRRRDDRGGRAGRRWSPRPGVPHHPRVQINT